MAGYVSEELSDVEEAKEEEEEAEGGASERYDTNIATKLFYLSLCFHLLSETDNAYTISHSEAHIVK